MPGSAGAATPATPTVADLGEHGLIARLRARVPPPPAWLAVGIGDDAAVVEPPRNQLEVLTTDVLVEGVHFDRRFSTAADIGHKALAVNLSDLAAMGAEPRSALLSLALPAALAVAEFDALLDGFLALAARHRLALVGGNLAQSPGPLVVDVTAVGAVRRRRALTRAGGRPEDELFLSGRIGGAAAGLARLQALGAALAAGDPEAEETVRRYRRPDPRVRLGLVVARNRAASACVDLSDGLADAVRQLAAASGTGAELDAGEIPVEPGARAWSERQGRDALADAVAGGEDYELLFAVPRRRRRAFLAAARLVKDTTVTRIGRLTPPGAVVLARDGRTAPLPAGFAHFGLGG